MLNQTPSLKMVPARTAPARQGCKRGSNSVGGEGVVTTRRSPTLRSSTILRAKRGESTFAAPAALFLNYHELLFNNASLRCSQIDANDLPSLHLFGVLSSPLLFFPSPLPFICGSHTFYFCHWENLMCEIAQMLPDRCNLSALQTSWGGVEGAKSLRRSQIDAIFPSAIPAISRVRF